MDKSIGALWISDNPKIAFSGSIDMESGKVRLVVFKNSFKKDSERSPDYSIYLSQKQNKEESKNEVAHVAGDTPKDDDLPF